MFFQVGPVSVSTGDLRITGLFTSYSILYYLLGYYLVNRVTRKKRFGVSIALILIGWALAVVEVVLNVMVNGKMFDGVNDSFQCIDALILTIGIFTLFKQISIPDKVADFFRWLSKYILPIYIFHSLIIIVINELILIDTLSVLVAIVLTIVTDVICIFLGIALDKIPYIRGLIQI